MSDTDIYVEVENFAVQQIFDGKYKAHVIDLLSKSMEAAISKSGKFTLDKPKDKSKGWMVLGTVTRLGPDKAGKTFGIEMSVIVAVWPAKAIKATLHPKSVFEIKPGDKITASDVDQVTKDAAAAGMKDAIAFMSTRKPE